MPSAPAEETERESQGERHLPDRTPILITPNTLTTRVAAFAAGFVLLIGILSYGVQIAALQRAGFGPSTFTLAGGLACLAATHHRWQERGFSMGLLVMLLECAFALLIAERGFGLGLGVRGALTVMLVYVRNGWLDREGVTMVFSVFCLYLLLKFGRPGTFRRDLAEYAALLQPATLTPYVYLSVMCMLTRVAMPLAFIYLVLRERPRDFGYRLTPSGQLGAVYALLLLVMVPLLWTVAGWPAFQGKYPLYDEANQSWSIFIVYEACYFFVFFSGEAFVRGFLLFALFRRFGWHALSVAMLPYVIYHFGKPIPETLGAILTAYVLGYLALKHRSWWLGIALHFSIAFLMDIFSMIRGGSLPSAW